MDLPNYTKDTLEDVLLEAFAAKQLPVRQENPNTALRADQYRVLGDMPIMACYLYNYSSRLASRGKRLIEEHDQGRKQHTEINVQLEDIKAKIEAVNNLMWVLIREHCPDSDHEDYRGITILPNWEIGGVLLTAEDRRNIAMREELEKSPLMQALHMFAG